VEGWIRATGIWPDRIDCARVVDQEGTWGELEEVLLAILTGNKVFRDEIFSRNPQAAGQTVDVFIFQQGAEHLTAIATFPAFDLFGHRLVVSMNDGIDIFDRQVAPFEQTAIPSVFVLVLSRQLFDCMDIRFELHVYTNYHFSVQLSKHLAQPDSPHLSTSPAIDLPTAL
jgi:hypothetical protein